MTGSAAQTEPAQSGVASWFDRTYRSEGFRYLRPYAAYPLFVQLLDLEEGAPVLDVACGPGLLLRAAKAWGLSASGVDLSREALALGRTYVPECGKARANAQRLPFADESFQGITCLGSIERFLDRGAALDEMHRVARPDARFCFMVRNANTVSWRVWRQWFGKQNTEGHQDALGLEGWRDLFDRHGFAVERVIRDQWPRRRVWWWLSGRREPTPRRRERLVVPLMPLRWANEFIFVLRKADR